MNGPSTSNLQPPTLQAISIRKTSMHFDRFEYNPAADLVKEVHSVEGMKIVCHEVAQAANDLKGSAMNQIVKDADRPDSVLANKVAQAFGFGLVRASSRSFKYVLNILKQITQSKTLVHGLEETTLDILVTDLMLCLLDERVPRMAERDYLLKALNVLLLKIMFTQFLWDYLC